MLASLDRPRAALLGAAGLAVVTAAGFALRDVVPPADAWIVENWYAAPDSAAGRVATAVSGAGTLLCLGLLIAAVAVAVRQGGGITVFTRAAAVAGAGVAVLGLQRLILRPGPPLQPEAGTYPSGHATVATAAVATALVLVAARASWRRWVLIAGGASVLLVSASRVVLAEHWLVDVTAGIIATAGAALLAIALLGFRREPTG